MGSFTYTKRKRGKVKAPLNKLLDTVKWGDFSFDKLFKTCTVKNKLTKLNFDNNGKTPVYSSDSTNNGIAGYTNYKAEFIISNENPIYIVFGDHTRSFNIALESFCVMDNVKVLSLKEVVSIKVLLFIISSWKQCIPNLGYSRHWSLAKKALFSLPILKNKKIDFNFIEKFISELEQEKISQLDVYLEASELKDYRLTMEEQKALEDFKNGEIKFKEFKIYTQFKVDSYKKRFDANKVEVLENGKFPYVVRMSSNNGQKGYINEDEQFLNNGNTISFGQDTATMYYQEKPYFTGDKIKILKPKNPNFNKKNALFFISTMRKSFSSFSWGGSSFNVDIINKQPMNLAVKGNEPNYKLMETLIAAIQKQVIKDVVLYTDKKLGK